MQFSTRYLFTFHISWLLWCVSWQIFHFAVYFPSCSRAVTLADFFWSVLQDSKPVFWTTRAKTRMVCWRCLCIPSNRAHMRTRTYELSNIIIDYVLIHQHDRLLAVVVFALCLFIRITRYMLFIVPSMKVRECIFVVVSASTMW